MSSSKSDDQLVSDREELLALLLAEETSLPDRSNGMLRKVNRDMPIPLSFTQERLWFLEQLQPGSALYNFHGSLKITGNLDSEALRSSLQSVVRRHEILRTTFSQIDGEAVQRISEEPALELAELDLAGMDGQTRETRLRALSEAQVQSPFNLETGPLLRALLVRVGTDEHHLLLTTHHIITDGWGMSVFFRDLAEFYKARVKGIDAGLEPVVYQYADIAYSQRQSMDAIRRSALIDYWKNRLAGAGEPLDLPADRSRPDIQSVAGAHLAFELSAERTLKLRKFGQSRKYTSFMILLAVFKVLLYRYSGRTDILVGTPVAERKMVEMELLVGVFVNNLVLRTDLSGEPDFLTLLQRVAQTSLEAFEHQDLPFEMLVSELNLPRDRSRSPLFQVMFVYQNAPAVELGMEGLSIVPEEFHSDASEYDVSLYVRDRQDSECLECWFEYSTALFNRATIERMKGHFENLLDNLLSRPDCSIVQVPMLSSQEHEWLVTTLNATAVVTPALDLATAISRKSAEHPDRTAVVCEFDALTYGQLDTRSNQLARYLLGKGVKAGTRIGVLLDRDEYLMVGLLGVLKAGAAYVPMDPAFPVSRLAYMCENSEVPIILATQALMDSVPDTDAMVICLDLDWSEIDSESGVNPGGEIALEQTAYVIYTSGSTGQPKGVEVTHGNVINFIHAVSQRPGFHASDSLLAVTTISFDIHVLELYLPLYCGGQLHIASRETAHDGFRLLAALRAGNISVMQATPATWNMLINSGWDQALELTVLCGGEKLSRELADALLGRVSVLWNMYGPTETTVWSAAARILNGKGPITIGQPLDNTQLYVVDAQQELLPVGIPGELLIGGAGVARGYLGRQDLTLERFIPRPDSLGNHSDGATLYRTGDLARYREDGSIEILGRMDNQVKLRGYRIETGEIERVLEEHEAVNQAVVLLREDNPGDQRLVAYVKTETDRPSTESLSHWLSRFLPDYMVPTAFVWQDSFPMTPNNKIDRKSLPQPDQADITTTEFMEAETALERTLVAIFKSVLNVDRVGRYDNFFDLGGHSLLAMKVVSRFEAETGLRMRPAELFQQTIGQIAAYHDKSGKSEPPPGPGSLRGKLRGLLKSLQD